MSKRKPNFTQVPNEFLDDPTLTNPEHRVLMIICRNTYGWHKDKDKISLSQFMEKSPMSKNTIIKAIRGLKKKGFIEKETHKINNKVNSISEYAIKELPEIQPPSSNNEPPIGESSSKTEQPLVQKLNTQNKNINKEPDKINIEPKAPRAKPKKEPNLNHTRLMKWFQKGYMALNNGEKPKIDGKDGQNVKKILKVADNDMELIKAKLNVMYRIMEKMKMSGVKPVGKDFIKGSGFQASTLYCNWNTLDIPKPKEDPPLTVAEMLDGAK